MPIEPPSRSHHRPSGAPPGGPPRGRAARLVQHFRQRVDPLTSLFLVLPLFVIYHLGVLLQMRCTPAGCAWRGNGVDFITARVMQATNGSLLAYAATMVSVALALTIAILWARRRARVHPRLFIPVLAESAVYASLVGPSVVALQRAVGLGEPGNSLLSDVISSCGAGLHEELIFRAGLFAGGAFVLRKLGARTFVAVGVSAVVSALLFSAVHHLGPLGERFTVGAFVFRFLAGLIFTAVYRVRGFAIAAWTHALYDVWVFGMQHAG